MSRLVLIFLLGMIPCLLVARPVKDWTSEELTERASVVCNGLVEKTEQTGRDSTITFLGAEKFPVHVWRARIKVLAKFKGEIPPEFDLYYPQLDPAKLVGNGPRQVDVQAGQRYHFYLRPTSDGKGFVGVLDGEFDDGNAVELLGKSESDDSPPFLPKDALQLAADYVRSVKEMKNVEIEDEVPRVSGSAWIVEVRLKSPDGPASTAEIIVHTDRTISPESWVAIGPARKIEDLTANDIGKEVRIVTQFGNMQTAHRGVLEKILDMEVVIREPMEEDGVRKPASTHIIRHEIVSVQALAQT